MSNLADFIIYLCFTVGLFFVALGVVAFAADYVQSHRYDSERCYRLARWLDTL
jgi:hypothetical protein